MQFKYYTHVFLLILIVIAAGIAFHSIQNQSNLLADKGETTSAVVVSVSAYLALFSIGVLNQWFAYAFHQEKEI